MKPEEAKALLEAAERAEEEARLRLVLLGGWYLVLWGGLWGVGNLLLAWSPEAGERFWTVAGPLGAALSFYLGARQGGRVQSLMGFQTFALWGLLTLFALLHWIPLLPPWTLAGESFLVSLVAFAYAYMGVLWRLPGMVWAGLGLLALDLLLLPLPRPLPPRHGRHGPSRPGLRGGVPLALDPLIHQETRLRIVALLAGLGEGAKAEFTWLKEALGLTEGNLSSHLQKLEEAGYVRVEKGFRGKRPKTWVALTPEGRAAYEAYRKALLDLLQGR